MKKRFPRALQLASAGAAMLALGAFPSVNAAAREAQATQPQLNSGINVQNLGSSPATIVITMVNSDGSAALTVTDPSTLAPNASKSYYVPTNSLFSSLPDGFNGGAVIDSDQPIAASVNLSNDPLSTGDSDGNPYRLTTYTGFASTDAAQTLYFPEVTRYNAGGFNYNSVLSIQNAGSTATNVTVTYYNPGTGAAIASPGCTTTQSVAANASVSFKQQDCTGLGTFNGSAVVTADAGGKIAGVAIKSNGFTNVASSQFLDYNGMSGGSTKLYVPKVVNHYSSPEFNGGVSIQNIGASATNVTITYNFGGQTYVKTITNLQPQASSVQFSPNVVLDNGGALPSGAGSAVITSSASNIIATVNESNDTLGYADTYRAFTDGAQTTKLSFPTMNAAYGGFTSGIAIQN